MPAVTWADPGSDATGDLSRLSATSGTVASATDRAATGPRSYKLSTSSPATTATGSVDGQIDDTGWASARFNVDSLPDAATNLLVFQDNAFAGILRLRLSTAGVLSVQDVGSGTTIGSGSTALSVDTFYQITVCWTLTSTSVNEIRVYLNGSLEITITNATLTRVGMYRYQFTINSAHGANKNLWVDDVIFGSDTDLAYPGSVRVTHKRPVGNGATNTFDTTAGSGSGYGSGRAVYVNDIPVTGTNGIRHNGAGTASENFVIEGKAVGSVDLSRKTILACVPWVRASGVSTDTIMWNGSESVPSPAFSGSQATLSLAPQPLWPANTTTMPAVGMGRPTGSATDAIMQDCGVIVAYLDDVRPPVESAVATIVPAGAAGTRIYVGGLSFTPIALFAVCAGRTESTDTVGAQDSLRSVGLAVSGSSRAYVVGHSADASGTSQSDRAQGTDAIIRAMTDAGAFDGALDVEQFTEDGVILIVDQDFGVDVRVSLTLWGGPDLGRAHILTGGTKNGTGTQAYTGPGWRPSFGLLISAGLATNDGTTGTHSINIIGLFEENGGQGVLVNIAEDGRANIATESYCNDAECWARPNTTGGNPQARASWSSMENDGFVLNFAEGNATNWLFSCLLIEGGEWKVGSIATRTDGNDIAVTPGFWCAGGMVLSHGRVESTLDSAQPDDHFSVGMWAADPKTAVVTRVCHASFDQDAAGTSALQVGVSYDELYQHLGSSGMVAELDLKSREATGVTYVMDDVESTAAFALYLLWGWRAQVTAVKMAATATMPASALRGGAKLSAVAATATALLKAATLTGASGGAQLTAGVLTATAALPAATIRAGARLAAGVLAAIAAVPSAVMTAGARIAAGPMTATALLPAAIMQAGARLVAVALAASAALPAATLRGGAKLAAAVLAASATVPSAVLTAGAKLTAGLLTASATMPAGALIAGPRLMAGAMLASADMPGAALRAGARLAGAVLTASAQMPAAALAAGGRIAAGALIATATVRSATLTGGAKLLAGVGAALAVMPAGAMGVGATVLAGVLTATGAARSAAVTAGARLAAGPMAAAALLRATTVTAGARVAAGTLQASAQAQAAVITGRQVLVAVVMTANAGIRAATATGGALVSAVTMAASAIMPAGVLRAIRVAVRPLRIVLSSSGRARSILNNDGQSQATLNDSGRTRAETSYDD